MKLKTQILVIALGLAASTSLVWSADKQLSPEAGPAIVGVWEVTRHGVNCNDPTQEGPPFPALVTFHDDGTMTADTGGASNTNEYGSWQREPGRQNYSFRDRWNGFDENGAFVYYGVITATVHLADANNHRYSATIQLFDPDGNLFFTACGAGTGERFE